MLELTVDAESEEQRLDAFLTEAAGLSRQKIQKLIAAQLVTVNGVVKPKSYRLKEGDLVVCQLPKTEVETVAPEPIPLEIVYQDDEIIVINKQAGLVVHPAFGSYSGTLVNALLAITNLASAGAPLRPGIVHRLDKNTSGLLVVAKTNTAYYSLVAQMKKRQIIRKYLVLVEGVLKEDQGLIEYPIGRHRLNRQKMAVNIKTGKEASTVFQVKKRFANYSFLEAELKTGRTHQIRVHFQAINHPVAGDPTYSSSKSGRELGLTRQFLHAYYLQLYHPRTKELRQWQTPLPPDLAVVLARLSA